MGEVDVSVVASPSVEGWVLESACEGERNRPGEGAVFDNFGEVVGGLFWRLATGEEDDAS